MKARGRQLSFAAFQVGFDFEPMLRGELLAAMAALLLLPAPDEQPTLDGWGDYVPPPFAWPATGSALVHYPLGAHGPRVEHPPGVLCEFCQWQCDEQGWPIGAAGRQPRRWCTWCHSLIARGHWSRVAGCCVDCAPAARRNHRARVAQP